MKIENFRLGSDPELFLRRKDTGEYFPAIGLITGTKAKPTPMQGLPKGFTWQIDGVAIEYGIPPCATKEEWIKAHETALTFIRHNVDNEQFQLALDVSAEFSDEYLAIPGARVAGCEVDYNAWLQETNPKVSLEETNLRCTGGHVHISFDDGQNIETCEKLIKTFDLFLTLPSVLLESDRERRKLYGKAGSFRFGKSYSGVEARALSNFWITSPELMGWVYENTQAAINFINEGKKINEEDEFIIQAGINDYNEDFAREIVNKYKIKLPQTQLVKV